MATGFGVIAGAPAGITVLDAGVIATRAGQPLEARIHEIYEGVLELLDAYAPALLVLEDLYAEYKFPRTALQMAHARGVVCLAACQRGVPVLPLAPAEVKRAVSANGAASKEQIQHCVQRLLKLPELPRPSHVADALALAFTGLSRAGRNQVTSVSAHPRIHSGSSRPAAGLRLRTPPPVSRPLRP